jgi:hypothetical protein
VKQVKDDCKTIKEISGQIMEIRDNVTETKNQIQIIADKSSLGKGTDDHDLIKEAKDLASAAERDAIDASRYALETIGLANTIDKKINEMESAPKEDQRRKPFDLIDALKNLFSGIKDLLIFPLKYHEYFWDVIKEIYKIDGSPSASRAQFVLWTAVAAYSYIAITADKAIIHGFFDLRTAFPINLILAMGLSAGTAIVSQSISKPISDKSADIKGGILLDDAGNFDLGKIQMMAWTGIAAGSYLIIVYHNIFSGFDLPGLPDIDTSLLALMGIGDTTYLLKKKIDDKPA